MCCVHCRPIHRLDQAEHNVLDNIYKVVTIIAVDPDRLVLSILFCFSQHFLRSCVRLVYWPGM